MSNNKAEINCACLCASHCGVHMADAKLDDSTGLLLNKSKHVNDDHPAVHRMP